MVGDIRDETGADGAIALTSRAELDSSDRCSIESTLDLIGDRWTLLILRDIFRGVRRFSQLQSDLGIAKNLLADRLHRLVEHDIVHKVAYQDRPIRNEYRLTVRGQELSPALIALMNWGDRWCADGQPPTVLVHDSCDGPLEQLLICPDCDQHVGPTHIRSRPGGGAETAMSHESVTTTRTGNSS